MTEDKIGWMASPTQWPRPRASSCCQVGPDVTPTLLALWTLGGPGPTDSGARPESLAWVQSHLLPSPPPRPSGLIHVHRRKMFQATVLSVENLQSSKST